MWKLIQTDLRAATHRQRFRKMPAYDKEMQKKGSLCRQTSALDSLRQLQGLKSIATCIGGQYT
jgi:hypothetical protein